MKHLIALTALAAILVITGSNLVLAKSYGGGAAKPNAEGTITDVGTRGFKMTVAAPAARKSSTDAPAAANEKIITVICDNNTKFQSGGQPADGTIVKTGAHVAITGATSGVDTLNATIVNLVTDHKKK